ncbi:MAG: M23 family metallopeptidase [Oscillospiraceae bacterium]|nr:M23 family metallopeptidase [Oscillospiraceae bacterium]
MTKKSLTISIIIILVISIIISYTYLYINIHNQNSYTINSNTDKDNDFIKWVDFNIPYNALEKSMKIDINTYNTGNHISWIDILALLGTKYGGKWSKYSSKDIDNIIKDLNNDNIDKDNKYYQYYHKVYTAVLGNFISNYEIESEDTLNTDNPIYLSKYGLKAYSPIPYGYNFSHYDDFGNSRSFGFKRPHLGNDIMGNVGTPIISIESGYVENIGWNQYGGWRIGIRSLDKKRYYYYAHLKKDSPYIDGLEKGSLINAGDIIGYLGMTGYSKKENVNGMTKPHLHLGLQLIFDESQKEGNNEIWIDVYQLVKLLQKHKSPVVKDQKLNKIYRKYRFIDPLMTEYINRESDSE